MIWYHIFAIKDSWETEKSECEIKTIFTSNRENDWLCIEGYDMANNSFPAEEMVKHICKHKKSRALGHEDKGATLSERGKNA